MKFKNILYTGLALMSLTACNDYLDVDAPSKYTDEFVYSQESEIERALNGVYAQALVNNLYGNAYQRTFILNSDVDMQISSSNSHAHNSYARLDCDEQGSEIYSFWTAAYNLIEYCNKFIYGVENSPLYQDKSNANLMQWEGEAKCLRAMAYHDLVVMFGDVPFSLTPSSQNGSDYVLPIVDREEIQKALINDLREITPYMKNASSVTVERCSKEFAQGLIARIALTAGGYSLHPDKNNAKSYGTMSRPDDWQDLYAIARDYCDSVITSGTHKLKNSFQDVFVNECNYKVVNDDDPIFEIPFAKESTGNTGYLQGPTYSAYENKTVGSWGACSGSARLNAFYRFLFRSNDVRREQVNGLWYYSYYTKSDGTLADSVYIRNDYSVHDNKWSKLWTEEGNTLGNDKTGSTGINYPYMRYADILLMYAETANELNDGPTDKAVDCLTQVHKRAFPTVADGDAEFITEAKTSKDAFLKAVLDERKWEFAGENTRWRDLVRTNTYGKELIYSFLRYYTAAAQSLQTTSGYEDAINAHDGYTGGSGYIDHLPSKVYYHQYSIDEANAYAKKMYSGQLYGYVVDGSMNVLQKYPNQSLKSLRIYNAYKNMSQPVTSAIKRGGFAATAWNYATFYKWGSESTGQPNDQCKYSFYGYVRCDDNGNLWLIDNGTMTPLSSDIESMESFPAVRYILPYPNLAIQRSAGAYKNYYGY